MRTKLIRVGNSRGIRIPKHLIAEAGLGDELEVVREGATLVIRSPGNPREGWAEAFAAMAEQGDDHLLDPETPTTWDEHEWTWD